MQPKMVTTDSVLHKMSGRKHAEKKQLLQGKDVTVSASVTGH